MRLSYPPCSIWHRHSHAICMIKWHACSRHITSAIAEQSQHTSTSMATSSGKRSILWFRKGLRLHDNPALLEACSNASHLYPIFVIDPHFVTSGEYRVKVNRYNFLLESLKDLDTSLQKRGSRLLVLRGKPEEVIPRVIKEWQITHLCYEIDTEPYSKSRDAQVKAAAETAGVEVKPMWSHTLYSSDELVRKANGKPPLTMAAFCKLVDRVGPPPAPAPGPPAHLPGPAPDAPGTEADATSVPTWQEMGFKEAPTTIFKGGETEGLRRLEASLQDEKWVASFEKPATDPSAFDGPATTVLSPYLKFGCVSARLFYQKLQEVYARHPKHSQPPVSLHGQLLWREFFYTVGAHTPNFNKMQGNPLCRQFQWDTDPERLAAWSEGRTGFPWIDAIMIQLRTWGWIHHLARHSVACFLTRGDLYISWEKGQDVFEEYLLDQDHFLNAANWMWLSASAFFNQFFRVYSPITFGKKYDPSGKYVRKWLPVLKDMPDKYIYEPWTAPLDVQQKAGCVIGKDYPAPIVDHPTASKSCIARHSAAYKSNKAHDADSKAGTEEHGIEAKGKEGTENYSVKKAGGSSTKPAAKPAAAGKKRSQAASKATQGVSEVKEAAGTAAKGAAKAAKGGLGAASTATGGGAAKTAAARNKRQKTLQETGFGSAKK